MEPNTRSNQGEFLRPRPVTGATSATFARVEAFRRRLPQSHWLPNQTVHPELAQHRKVQVQVGLGGLGNC